MEDILKAIEKWIEAEKDESITKLVSISTILPLYQGMVAPGNIREQALRILCKKSVNVRDFFNLICHDGEIDIEKNLRNDMIVGILEGTLTQLGCKMSKLDDRINKEYIKNAISDINNHDRNGIKNCLNKVKDWRNKIHPNRITGIPITDKDRRKAWKAHIIGFLIIAYVEYNKVIKKDSITKPLENWFKNNCQLVYSGMSDNFQEKYVVNRDEKLIDHLFNIIVQDRDLDELYQKIGGILDGNQKLTDADKLPDMERFIQLFLYHANCFIYNDAYHEYTDESKQSLTTGIEVLGKLCIHTNFNNENIITEVDAGCSNIANITYHADKELVFKTHFFRTLFLIASLKQAVMSASTGVCFYTRSKNVKIKIKEGEFKGLGEKDPPLYFIFNNKNFKQGLNTFDAQVKLGEKGKPIPIQVDMTRYKWCIYPVYFQNGKFVKNKEIKKVSFPGLENLDELWGNITNTNDEKPKILEPVTEKKQDEKIKNEDNTQKTTIVTDSLQKEKKDFNDHKEIVKGNLYGKYSDCITTLNELVKNIDHLSYDENKSFSGNITAIDTAEKKIVTELDLLRKQSHINRDKAEFEKYKENRIKAILKLDGSTERSQYLKEKAIEEIREQLFDDTKDLLYNKAILDDIFKNLKTDLSKIGFKDISKERMNILTQWVDKNWKWCALVMTTIVLAVVLMNVYDGDHRVRVPSDEAIPSLEGNTWRVSIMDGKKVFESAEVNSISGSNTHYRMRHITNTGEEIIVTFDVNWQKGTVISPELGEGTIERNKKLNELKIIFEKWTITKNY